MVENTIMHFEIPGDDLERLMEFYSNLFGWRFERAPVPEEYWLIQTVPGDEVPSIGTRINGGLVKEESSTRGFINYISVESLDDSCEIVERFGGKIIAPKREVSDMGWFVLVDDPEGNRFAIWQSMD